MKKEPYVPKIKTEPESTGNEDCSAKVEVDIKYEAISKLPIRTDAMDRIKTELKGRSDSEDSHSSESSDNDKYRCPICLSSYKNQSSGNPDVCEHKFCLECIEEWSKVS
jgi:hypothetical protein